MAVALTTTVNLVFGSAVMDPVTGVILNDEVGQPPYCYIISRLKCFDRRWTTSQPLAPQTPSASTHLLVSVIAMALSFAEQEADNYPEPGKRPLSSTSPTILENEDGSFYAAVGGSGGSRIFPAVFQVLLNLDWGMDVSAAIEYGRVHDQLFPTMVDADDTLPGEVISELHQKGHNVTGARVRFMYVAFGVLTLEQCRTGGV